MKYEHIRVYYPRGVRTGGPEALHQLVDALRSLGANATLVPQPGTESTPRVPTFERYDAPEAPKNWSAGADDFIVVPESFLPPLIRSPAEVHCWWLSVDFSPLFAAQRAVEYRQRGTLLNETRHRAARLKGAVARARFEHRLSGIGHFAQSEFARRFIGDRLGVDPVMLSDYTSLSLVHRDPRQSGTPTIAFNPAKGGHLVRSLQPQLARTVRWLPLENMTPEDVARALDDADVYLDLGHLPGKDRLPREAAARGAISILLARGAGSNELDFPIPHKHRISPSGDLVTNAVGVLERVLDDIPTNHLLQSGFRDAIANEPAAFLTQVRAAFSWAQET